MWDIFHQFFDPADNGFDLVDLAQVFGFIVLVGGTVAAVVRWNSRRAAEARLRERREFEERLTAALNERTKPIQPDANGGKSMPDLHAKVDLLIARQTEIALRMDRHIEDHGKRASDVD